MTGVVLAAKCLEGTAGIIFYIVVLLGSSELFWTLTYKDSNILSSLKSPRGSTPKGNTEVANF